MIGDKKLKTKLDETRTIIDFYGLSAIISKKWFDNMSGENKLDVLYVTGLAKAANWLFMKTRKI